MNTNIDAVLDVGKFDIAGALGLATEVGPWSKISPKTLVHLSMDLSLWHAGERICESAVKFDAVDAHEAVHALVDGLRERHQYRQSDKMATQFYDNGGKSRYADARFMHACETIAKVVLKRQYPILERQVERVDKAYTRVANDGVDKERLVNKNGSKEVRIFALCKLREINEHDAAHRLAQMWNMDYFYDEKDAEKFNLERMKKYIQWNDAFPGDGDGDSSKIPEVISTSEHLVDSFNVLFATVDSAQPMIGFDVEWGEESKGAALLQLSTTGNAVLIDIPALLDSVDGCDALEKTAGKLFAGRLSVNNNIVSAAGFSCSQDMSRLRASLGVRTAHWFTSTEGVLDIQPLICEDRPVLKDLGLSRSCENYLGKPLDKAEQCSLWDRRPLFASQCTYAALDAWAVAAIYGKLPRGIIGPTINSKEK